MGPIKKSASCQSANSPYFVHRHAPYQISLFFFKYELQITLAVDLNDWIKPKPSLFGVYETQIRFLLNTWRPQRHCSYVLFMLRLQRLKRKNTLDKRKIRSGYSKIQSGNKLTRCHQYKITLPKKVEEHLP